MWEALLLMSDDRNALIEELLSEALELPSEQWLAFLDGHCHDSEIRDEVGSLLVHYSVADRKGFLSALTIAPILDAPDPSDEQLIGHQLDDFKILRKIGSGGMGDVYLAEEVPLRRHVALKVLPPTFAHSERRLAWFTSEARSAAKLRHQSIVPVYRFGNAEGRLYIASEYVEGMNLAEHLSAMRRGQAGRRDRTSDEPGSDPAPTVAWDMKKCAGVVETVAEALAYAHAHNIIHRDVKPANILMDTQDRPRLTDFGLAKDLDVQTMSQTELLAGTPAYMSPEQISSEHGDLDHRTDIFSLGTVLYEILTLHPPFGGNIVSQVLHQIMFSEPRRVRAMNSKVPRDLETICHKALEKDRNDRYQSAGEMVADLQAFIADRPIPTRSPGFIRRTTRLVRERRALVLACAVGITALLAGFLLAPRPSEDATLSVTADRPGAKVYSRRFDIGTRLLEPRQLLGTIPLREVPIAPGYYRIVVVAANGVDSAEMTRLLDEPGKVYELQATILSTESVVDGMVKLDEGVATLGSKRRKEPGFEERQVLIDSFLIDPTEVSNREYKKFLDANENHPWPDFWGGSYRETWDDLPVVGVTWTDARTYCESKGKRLPTDVEWERAGRGLRGRNFPWEGDAGSLLERANMGKDEKLIWTEKIDSPIFRKLYEESVVPVDHRLMDCTSEDVLHLLGNVAEWTDSVNFKVVEGRIKVSYYERIVKGANWGSNPRESWDLSSVFRKAVDETLIILGFRCARSVQP